jgi:hypothetical protein
MRLLQPREENTARSQILRVNVKDQDISNATTIELPTNDISITGVRSGG